LFYIKLFYLRSKIIKTLVTHEKSLEQYHEQLEYVLSNYQSHGLKQGDFKNIVIGGLGGSGIGAKLAQNWFYRLSEIPINVVNDYHLPNFVNENTLVILQSYSGNAEEIKTNQDRRIDSAKTIFNFFKSSIQQKFVILCDRAMEPVAIRFAQQINENSKLEAFVQTIPEHNHNVLESYTDKLASNFVFIYTSENERVASRFEFLQGHLELDNNSVLPLYIPEYSLMTIYDMIYRTDWVSVFFANELDAALMEVPMISQLKEYLANLND
jgi:glucose-6-phosphate isomerase